MSPQKLEKINEFKHLSRCYSSAFGYAQSPKKFIKLRDLVDQFESSLDDLIDLQIDP